MSFAQVVLLEGLSIRMKDLFDRICTLDCGWPLLLFLNENPNVLMTDDDFAYLVDERAPLVQSNLYAMIDLGLTRHIDVAGITLFGITRNPILPETPLPDQRAVDRGAAISQFALGRPAPMLRR